jgi:hypothetical protein
VNCIKQAAISHSISPECNDFAALIMFDLSIIISILNFHLFKLFTELLLVNNRNFSA